MIRFDCPNCGKTIKASDSRAGKDGKCPGCGKPVHVPDHAAPSDDDVLALLGEATPTQANPKPANPHWDKEESPDPIDQLRALRDEQPSPKRPDKPRCACGNEIGFLTTSCPKCGRTFVVRAFLQILAFIFGVVLILLLLANL